MAAALGPPVGGVLVDFSWRWIFLVNLPLGLLALALGPLVLKRSPGSGAGVPDLRGALCLVVGVAALVWAIVEIPSEGMSVTKIAASVLLAIVAISVTVRRSRRHHPPAID
jgi:MFS family permease